MVVQELSRSDIHHVKLRPVGTASRHAVSHVLPVVREVNALQSHRSVVAQLVRVEEHARRTAQFVHHVEHTLVLQAVILVEIPLAVTLERCAYFFVVRHLFQSFEQLRAERNLPDVAVGNGIFCLYPCRSLRTAVVLQPAIRVFHLRSEIGIDRRPLFRHRILNALSTDGQRQCEYRQHTNFLLHA